MTRRQGGPRPAFLNCRSVTGQQAQILHTLSSDWQPTAMTTELITVPIWYGTILNLPSFGAIDDNGDDGCHAGFSGVPALLLAGTTASMIVLATAAPNMTALDMGAMIVASAAAATTASWVVACYVPQLIHSHS